MNAERVRAMVKKLAHVEETVQWGETLVFWVGDKAIGGKMFAVVPLDDDPGPVMSFSAGPERFSELIENEGVVPAPYMARVHWVALEHWGAIEARELASLVADAHALTYAKLPQRTRDVLALPTGERRKLVEARRRELAAAEESSASLERTAKKAAGTVDKKAGGKGAGSARKKRSRATRTSLR